MHPPGNLAAAHDRDPGRWWRSSASRGSKLNRTSAGGRLRSIGTAGRTRARRRVQ